jgi:hypothetical protein
MTRLTINGVFSFPYDIMNYHIVKGKIRRRLPPYFRFSLLTEGLAVGALVHGGICLMGAYQNPLQGAEIGILAVMCALLDSTLNALVCMTIHSLMILLFL